MPKDNVKIKRSPIHGRGVFALRRFKRGEVIGKSPLEVAATSRRKGPYYVNEPHDAPPERMFGPLRFLNHCRPANARLWDDGEVTATKAIRAGAEITIDYGGELGW